MHFSTSYPQRALMSSTDNFNNIISIWFEEREISIPDDFIIKIRQYQDLIIDCSSRMNIISRNDLDIMLERHILDSLVPINEIPEKGDLVDVGSGAGFPAIPIALVRPELKIVMVESIRKKVIFLNSVIAGLKLENISVWHGRIEDFRPKSNYNIATIRAVAPTPKRINHLKTILCESGKIIYYNKFNKYKVI